MSYKSYDHTCNDTLARSLTAIDNVRFNNAFEGQNAILKGRIINRIISYGNYETRRSLVS